MKGKIEIDIKPVQKRGYAFPAVHSAIFDILLFREVETDGKKRLEYRDLFRVVFRRFWPFSSCYVKLRHGSLKANAQATVLGIRRNMYGSAFMDAMEKAGIHVSVGDVDLAPWMANEGMVESIGKTIGRMFRKENEFLVCRRVRI